MFNLLKYEFKSNLKLITGMLTALLVWNIFLLTKINIWQKGATVAGSLALDLPQFIVIFIQGIKLLKRDLYGNTGYLVFSLPKRGSEIIGSKLIFALLEFILFGIVTLSLLLLQVLVLPDANINIINFMFSHIQDAVYFVIWSIVLFTFILILCYFSLAISSVAFISRKHGTAASYGIFIVLIWIIQWLLTQVVKVLPYSIPIKVNEFHNMNVSFYSFNMNLNIGFMILFIIIYGALFMGTSYLIDNKIDL